MVIHCIKEQILAYRVPFLGTAWLDAKSSLSLCDQGIHTFALEARNAARVVSDLSSCYMRLRHLHLPGVSSYQRSAGLQAELVERALRFKALPRAEQSLRTPPLPTLLTFQTSPTYTCGRREIKDITEEQIRYLRDGGRAEFFTALRGGQTTFHGPGQLTAYMVLALDRHGLSPRTYVRFLEDSITQTCLTYGIKAFTTENPGVWVTQEDKIASVGVHLRRNVASHGVGLNVSTDLSWFERIVACGLVGKRTASFESLGVAGRKVEDVADALAKTMASGLIGIAGVQGLLEQELEADANDDE